MDDTVERTAEAIARRAHEGQVDNAGEPYIEHPRRVAERAAVLGGPQWGAEAAAAAWLHDVVEDTDTSIEDLAAEGIPTDVLDAVALVTKTDGQVAEQYFAGIRTNRLALLVKTADLIDNTDPVRVGKLDAETRDRLGAKYARSLQLLLGADVEDIAGGAST